MFSKLIIKNITIRFIKPDFMDNLEKSNFVYLNFNILIS